MNRKQRRAKRKQPVKTNHNMTIQLAKARDLKTLAHRVESDRQAQRCLWLAVVSMNDAFGIGKGRLKFGNNKNPAPFPSMVVVFKQNKEERGEKI